MRKRVAGWALVPVLVIVTFSAAAQERPPSVAESLPSGITALAPSPPSGAPPDAASVARGTVLYETRLGCAPCHGLTGRGGPPRPPGPRPAAAAGAAANPNDLSFAERSTASCSVSVAGTGGMPLSGRPTRRKATRPCPASGCIARADLVRSGALFGPPRPVSP